MVTTNLSRLLLVLVVFSSCRSLSYFDSPNNLRNINGTLFLANGKSFSGKLVIETENTFGRPVKVYTADDKKPMNFNLSDVKAYSSGNIYYELKEIKEGINFGKQRYFMRRLTPEKSRMHLFEFLKRTTVNKTAVKHTPEFYVQLPNEETDLVYAANGNMFVPHFEEKVSKLVKDCPGLAQKVAEKQDGYFYAQVSLLKDKRAEVLMKIITEYNSCAAGMPGQLKTGDGDM